MTKEELATSGSSNYYSLGRLQLKYDRAGRRTDRGFFSNNRTNYLNLDTTQTYSYYTTNQQLSKIERTGASAQKARYAYDAGGRLTSQTLGNGAWTQYEYYASGALSKITHRKSSGTPAIFASVAYQYDKAGNVTKAILDDDALTYSGDATVTYAYDDAYRLTHEDCAPAGGSYRKAYRFKYEFDGVGNRTKLRYYNGSSTSTYTFEYSARNELTLMNDGTYDYQYSYDTRGNLTEMYVDQSGGGYGIRIKTFGWDADDRLVSVDDELWQDEYLSWSWYVDYKYDHAGRRVAKSVNGGAWRWYLYDGLKVVAEGTGTSSKMYYTTAPDDPGGIICRDASAGTNPLYYHYDRLGNVMAVSDSNGAPYALYTMSAFGSVLEKGTSTGYSSEHGTDPQPYHLTTKEYDNDSGLYYFNVRWYDSWSGRFLSRDPMPPDAMYPITYNSYVTCWQNPANSYDIMGLEVSTAKCERIARVTSLQGEDSWTVDTHTPWVLYRVDLMSAGTRYSGFEKVMCDWRRTYKRVKHILRRYKNFDTIRCSMRCGEDEEIRWYYTENSFFYTHESKEITNAQTENRSWKRSGGSLVGGGLILEAKAMCLKYHRPSDNW
jgi:RHS repeat-associated protein